MAGLTETTAPDIEQGVLEKLLANPVLGKADPARLKQVVGHCKIIRYREGRKLIREGEPAEFVYALVTGGARVFHRGTRDDEIVVKLFGAPVFFGEADVLLGIRWLESVETILPSEVIQMPGNVFSELLRRDHGLCYAMVHDLATRLLIATEHERSLASGSAEGRLAAYFLDHVSLFGTPDKEGQGRGTVLDVHLSQDALGRSLAISRKTVNQALRKWTEDGILTRRSGRYVILDTERLRAMTTQGHFGLAYKLDPIKE